MKLKKIISTLAVLSAFIRAFQIHGLIDSESLSQAHRTALMYGFTATFEAGFYILCGCWLLRQKAGNIFKSDGNFWALVVGASILRLIGVTLKGWSRVGFGTYDVASFYKWYYPVAGIVFFVAVAVWMWRQPDQREDSNSELN